MACQPSPFTPKGYGLPGRTPDLPECAPPNRPPHVSWAFLPPDPFPRDAFLRGSTPVILSTRSTVGSSCKVNSALVPRPSEALSQPRHALPTLRACSIVDVMIWTRVDPLYPTLYERFIINLPPLGLIQAALHAESCLAHF